MTYFRQEENLYIDDRVLIDNSIRESLKNLALKNLDKNIYVLNVPLPLKHSRKYEYEKHAFMIIIPGYKIIFCDLSKNSELFKEYQYDILDSISELLGVYGFKDKEFIGRPHKWFDKIKEEINSPENLDELDFDYYRIENLEDRKRCEIVISLLLGSINDANKITTLMPEGVIEKIKQRIIIFDAYQLKFLYGEPRDKKTIIIQGLSGTGKTELLFHKLRELYLLTEGKILFTCHNKILANDLKRRVIEFFNITSVNKQIEEDRLMIMHAWGSRNNIKSGAYRYITYFYGLDFYTYSEKSFADACKVAYEQILRLKNHKKDDFQYAFDYILIDESQDLPDGFFDLCELVCKEKVYIVGDIFQSIFRKPTFEEAIKADIILNKCYRTNPKTLMFGHALCMGLFEDEKLNWIDSDDGWLSLGYNIEHLNGNVKLQRIPVKRFDDIDEEELEKKIEELPVDIIQSSEDEEELIENIVNQIEKYLNAFKQMENTSLSPDDVAVIFVDDIPQVYIYAEKLPFKIYSKFGWECNIAFKSKKRKEGKLFITNRNNVKGLEFPFVICIVMGLSDDVLKRNAIYSMLTRSFIGSSLIVCKIQQNLLSRLNDGLKEIKQKNYILSKEPSESEKQKIRERLIRIIQPKNLEKIIEEVMKKKQISDAEVKKKIKGIVKIMYSDKLDWLEEDIEKEIEFYYKKLS
ncbi:DEAD/DEAH box helicase [Thermodesulfatator atlanticus]|uniref:DEAD/DEAH box helicase n=1 Tax=Thermodesulfatator atlanticus TaxID=501497 RepID=UPI0003B49FE5|nr:AAA family ATPase [Thermodesulfatator atlanticus]